MIHISVLAKLDMQLGECPRWNTEDEAWYWVDITGKTLYRFDSKAESLHAREFDFNPACFAFTDNNEILLTSSEGVYLLKNFNAPLQLLTNPEAHLPQHRFNDGVSTPDGGFIAGTISDGNTADGTQYRFDFQLGTLVTEELRSGFTIINGQAFSPDGQWFYITDTPTQTILKCPYDAATKTLGTAEIFHKFEQYNEFPDGAAVDAQGNYWVAMYGAGTVCVISPEGEKIHEILLPVSQPTMVAFGGKNMQQLLVTTANQYLDEKQLSREPLAGSTLIIDLDDPGTLPTRVKK